MHICQLMFYGEAELACDLLEIAGLLVSAIEIKGSVIRAYRFPYTIQDYSSWVRNFFSEAFCPKGLKVIEWKYTRTVGRVWMQAIVVGSAYIVFWWFCIENRFVYVYLFCEGYCSKRPMSQCGQCVLQRPVVLWPTGGISALRVVNFSAHAQWNWRVNDIPVWIESWLQEVTACVLLYLSASCCRSHELKKYFKIIATSETFIMFIVSSFRILLNIFLQASIRIQLHGKIISDPSAPMDTLLRELSILFSYAIAVQISEGSHYYRVLQTRKSAQPHIKIKCISLTIYSNTFDSVFLNAWFSRCTLLYHAINASRAKSIL